MERPSAPRTYAGRGPLGYRVVRPLLGVPRLLELKEVM